MSFTVRASNSPLQQRSPVSQPYVSPHMPPQSSLRQGIPSFSLSGMDDSHNTIPPKKTGTAPAKYKTTICRNWEQTGTCSFRGCTFAHGVEELRAPVRMDSHCSPNLDPRRPSPGSTPPLYPVSLSGANGTPGIEKLLEMLYTEVVRERDLVAVHMEANRTLEAMLKKEQVLHEETKGQLEAAKHKVKDMTLTILQTSDEISAILDTCKVNDTQRSRIAALSQKMIDILPDQGKTCREEINVEENRVKELLKAIQQYQEPTKA